MKNEEEIIKAHNGMVIRFTRTFGNKTYSFSAIGIEVKDKPMLFYISGASERPFQNGDAIPKSPCTWNQIKKFADKPIELATSWIEAE